jgi:hypothetical protein
MAALKAQTAYEGYSTPFDLSGMDHWVLPV